MRRGIISTSPESHLCLSMRPLPSYSTGRTRRTLTQRCLSRRPSKGLLVQSGQARSASARFATLHSRQLRLDYFTSTATVTAAPPALGQNCPPSARRLPPWTPPLFNHPTKPLKMLVRVHCQPSALTPQQAHTQADSPGGSTEGSH